MSRPRSRRTNYHINKWKTSEDFKVFTEALTQQTDISCNHVAGLVGTCLAMYKATAALPRQPAIMKAVLEEAKSTLPNGSTPSYLQYWSKIGAFASACDAAGCLGEIKSLGTADRLRFAANRFGPTSLLDMPNYVRDAATLSTKDFDLKYPPSTRRVSTRTRNAPQAVAPTDPDFGPFDPVGTFTPNNWDTLADPFLKKLTKTSGFLALQNRELLELAKFVVSRLAVGPAAPDHEVQTLVDDIRSAFPNVH